MKITLQYPFTEWNNGYLVTNKENRKNVILYNTETNRTTISYARYLMSVHLGRTLTQEEQVDHIDNDKTNDEISNLQILSREDNIKKSSRQKTMIEFTCPICGEIFKVEKRQTWNKKTRCCSRRCGGIFSRTHKKED